MRCPFCRKDNDRVIDSRASQDGLAIRRRRECVACNRRYTTYERPEETTIKVIKRDGSRPFDREKILRGLERACWKRQISTRQIEATVTEIENDVYQGYESEIESSELGRLVMEHLRELDQVAFVRFASVYRQFRDAQDFVDELRPFLENPRKTPR